MWFTEFFATSTNTNNGPIYADHVGMINTITENITQITLPLAPGASGAGAEPTGITLGPDGNVWFTERGILAGGGGEIPQTGNAIGEVVLGKGMGRGIVPGGFLPHLTIGESESDLLQGAVRDVFGDITSAGAIFADKANFDVTFNPPSDSHSLLHHGIAEALRHIKLPPASTWLDALFAADVEMSPVSPGLAGVA
jgi:hypothetical protein